MLRSASRLRLLLAGCAAVFALGTGLACDRGVTAPREVGPDGRAVGRLVMVVPIGDLTATTLVVEVSAVDIVPTMVFNLPVVAGVATGSITVPAGAARLFTVRAFDGSTETHRGTKLLSIVAGVNPTASITLTPLAGTVPITASLGSLVITITPLIATGHIGDTIRFNATIRDAAAAIIPGPARWASTNTAKVTVDTAGLATVLDTGAVIVVATYSTSAGTAGLTGTPSIAGPPPATLRTWVGGTGSGSTRNDWATANNWSPSFVPTAADSVVIAAATFQPNIPLDTFTVRDLTLRTGATLSASFGGIRLRVMRTASGEGGTFVSFFGGLIMRNGSTVRGTLPTSIIVNAGSGSTLADSARIRDLTVDGAAADFALAGKHLAVTANVYVNNGGLLHMTAAADTLDVTGTFQITTSAAPHFGSLTAGFLILRNVSTYFDNIQASGTHTTVFAGTVAQSVYYMDYVARPTNSLQNVVVSGPGGVAFQFYSSRVRGSFSVLAGAGPVSSPSGYTLRIEGPLTTATGTAVAGANIIELQDPTGTANVSGTWSPAYTDFSGVAQTIKAGLGYQNLRLYQSQTFADSVRASGQLTIDGASTVLNITSPRRIIVGSVQLSTSGTFILDAASDTLEVHGDINTSGGGNSLTKLTDGTIILWGSLYGNNFSATGNNLVKFDNPGVAVQHLYSFNPSATPVTGFQNVEVSGSANLDIESQIKIGGYLKVSSPVVVNSLCGSCYGLYVTGPINSVAGSNISPYFVQMGHISGTNRVLGSWSPGYTDVVTPGDTLKPGLAYQTVRFYAADSLQVGGVYTFTGDLYADGVGVVVGMRGAKATVQGQMFVQNSSRFLMVDGDTLSVAGNLNWYSSVASVQTGGQINWGGQTLNMTGYAPGGGTHKLRVTNATVQPRINTTDPTLRPFARLEIASPFGVILDGSIAVTDSFVVSGTGVNAKVQTSYYYSIETRGAIVSAATSTIMPSYLDLNGTTTLTGVAGNFAPGIIRVYQASPGLLRNAPGFQYSDIAFYTSYTLNDSLTTTPNTIAFPSNWTGSVSVNNTGTQLDLGGHRLRLSGGFDANTNAILKMVTSAADTLIVGDGTTGATGNLYLDGGASANSILNTGTIILRGNTSLTNATFGPTNTLVLTDSGLAPGARTFTFNSGNTLNNVIVRGSSALTVTMNANYVLNGNFDLQAGPTFTSNYYYVWRVNGPVTTAVGSAVTGIYNYIELGHPTGTNGVNGLWSPYVTRFNAVAPIIKPALAYQNMEFNSSATFSGNTNLAGYMYVTNPATNVALGGHKVTVGGYFQLISGATLSMTLPADTLAVAGNFTSDNGTVNSNITDGVIRVRGDVNANRLNPTGASKFVLDSSGLGTPQAFYTSATPFNKVEIRTNRQVRFDGPMTFNDSLTVLSPTTFGNSYCCYTFTVMGPLSTVASSSVLGGGGTFALAHITGTSLINGIWNPYITRFLTANSTINPALAYQNMEFNAAQTFSANTAMSGYLYATGSSTVVNTGGHAISVGGYFQLVTSATLNMTLASDTLAVGAYFNSDNSTTNSNVTNGVIRVRGDVNANRLNPTGGSKFVLDSLVSAAPQTFYTNATQFNNVEVRTNRTVRFDNSITIGGALSILTPTVVGNTCCYTFTFVGPVTSVAASTLQGGNLRFQDATAADNILGNLNANGNEVQLNTLTTSTVPVAPRFAYTYLRIMGLSAMQVGATLQLGPSGVSAPGTLYVDATGGLTIPSTSTLHACSDIQITSPGSITLTGGTLKSRVVPSGPTAARVFGGTVTAPVVCP